MKTSRGSIDYGLVLVLLRTLLGWSQSRLARESGIDKGLISNYERGLTRPIRKTREQLARVLGVEPAFLEQLVPVCRSLRLAFEAARQGGGAGAPPTPEAAQRLEEKVAGAILEAMQPSLLELAQLDTAPGPCAEDRSWAEERWAALEPLDGEDQAQAVQVLQGDDRSWALALRLCKASQDAAPHSAEEALRLARLSVRLAEAALGPEAWRLRLLGACEPFLANALRVGGSLGAAEESSARADEHWRQGEGGDPLGLLDGTRRLDLKASLLKVLGRFDEALALLDQAFKAVRTDHERGRLLLKRAFVLELAGDYEAALAALGKAEPLIDPQIETRLPCVLLFNRGVNYCHLDRYRDAEKLLPRIEALAANLSTKLDGTRTLWLQGRTWAGLGRREEAIAALAGVRQVFLDQKIAYDYALVSLELATLHLEQGRTRLVQEMAEEMAWIFKGEKVHKEALAALRLFQEAARMEKARAEWTRRMVKYLYRAQGNPRLRFER
jgi:transcriptional regulator with XRE-family HTH domain